MSMESRCTIGAIASKNASAFSSVSSRMASASGAEVRGPVATMTLRQSAGGRPSISARRISIRGWSFSALVTAAENPSRSTASAPPAGTWLASAARMISEPSRRISACSRPTALLAASSERNELEQTSSARPSVRCASVIRSGASRAARRGRRHWRPARRLPSRRGRRRRYARVRRGFGACHGHRVARFSAVECVRPDTTTPAAVAGVIRSISRLKNDQPL